MPEFSKEESVDVPVLDETKETGMREMVISCGSKFTREEVETKVSRLDIEYIDSVVPHNALSEGNVVGLAFYGDPTPDVENRNPDYLYKSPEENYVERGRYHSRSLDGVPPSVDSNRSTIVDESDPVFAYLAEIDVSSRKQYTFYLPAYNTSFTTEYKEYIEFPYLVPISDESLAQNIEALRTQIFTAMI